MKKIILLFSSLIIFGCSSSDDGTTNSSCDLNFANQKFAEITGLMSYSDVENLIGVPGNNFRTDNLGPSGEMKFYRWDFCEDNKYFECWIINDERLNLKTKYFGDNTCSANVYQSNYLLISIGDSLSQIRSLLGNQGDNIRIDYNNGIPNIKY